MQKRCVLYWVLYHILFQAGMHACTFNTPYTALNQRSWGPGGGGGGGGEVPHHKLIFVQCDIQESNVTRVHKGTNGSDLA